MISSEEEVLQFIDRAGRIFLLEPDYNRKYPPLGLMKISSRVRSRGGKVKYGRWYLGEPCDLICVTSLFTYEYAVVLRSLRQAIELGKNTPIIIGGVCATLMASRIEKDIPEIRIFPGYSKILDGSIPDYSIDWRIEKPWDNFSFSFTSRGCPNGCAYCAVKKLEPSQWINPEWKKAIVPEKSFAMISDNNLSACPRNHIEELIDFLRSHHKRVIFDNGMDCKLIDDDLAFKLASLRFTRHGMRMAFDRIEEDGVFQNAVKKLLKAGVPRGEILIYVLFNFLDSPKEADYRMRECVKLGIRPYPQKFCTLGQTTRKSPFIGKYWTRRLANRFRYFWLMAGLYSKREFGDWIMEQRRKNLVTDEDISRWLWTNPNSSEMK